MSWQQIERLYLDQDYYGLIKELRSGSSFPDDRDDQGSTLLHHACGAANLPTVYILLTSGVNVNVVNTSEETALGYLCSYHDNDESARVVIAKSLLSAGHWTLPTSVYPNGYATLAAQNAMNILASELG